MRTFVNCLKFKIAPILFSVILALSLPLTSFRSQALASGTTSYAAGYMLYTIYRTCLGLLGVTSDHEDLPDPSNFTEDVFDALISPIRTGLNAYHDYLGDYFVNQIKAAYGTGKIMFDYAKWRLIKQYFGTLSTSDSSALEIGSSVDIGSVYDNAFIVPANSSFTTLTGLADSQTGNRTEIPITFTFFYESVIFRVNSSDTANHAYHKYFVITKDPITSSGLTYSVSYDTSTAANWYGFNMGGGSIRTSSGYINYFMPFNTHSRFSYSFIPSYVNYLNISDTDFINSYLDDIVNEYRSTGSVSTSSSLSGSVVDTDSDQLSSSSDIATDGSVSGFLSVPVLKQSISEAILDALRSGGITYDDFVKALGAESVSVESTPSEKEAAQDSITYPTDSVLTDSETGSTTLDNVKNEVSSLEEIESTLTEEIEETLDDGSGNDDDEDKKVPYWPLWRFPDWSDDPGGIDDDDDSSDPARLPEIVASVVIIGSILEDFFNASGGASGFGFIYIVGVSFVLFSVLIGAAHFFGSFGSRSDVRETRSNNRKASAERLMYWQNKNRK